MPERLRRLETVFQRHPIYFITASTHERRPILAHPTIQLRLTKFAEAGAAHGAWLGAYVLMPDHLRLFVAVDDTRLRLSAWMKSLKNALSRTLRDSGVPSPHWQKGFFDHVLRGDESYSAKWEYVRQNPVRACLVEMPTLGNYGDRLSFGISSRSFLRINATVIDRRYRRPRFAACQFGSKR
jgi:putative transposase